MGSERKHDDRSYSDFTMEGYVIPQLAIFLLVTALYLFIICSAFFALHIQRWGDKARTCMSKIRQLRPLALFYSNAPHTACSDRRKIQSTRTFNFCSAQEHAQALRPPDWSSSDQPSRSRARKAPTSPGLWMNARSHVVWEETEVQREPMDVAADGDWA